MVNRKRTARAKRKSSDRGRNKPQPKPGLFRPTAGMQRFVACELVCLGKRRPYTQKDVARDAKISEFQASRWHDIEGYDVWRTKVLHRAAVSLFHRGKVAVGHRILMTGDPKELEIFGRVLGLVGGVAVDDEEGAGAGVNPGGMTMNFLVPAPPIPPEVQEQAAKRLPPPYRFPPNTINVLVPRPESLAGRTPASPLSSPTTVDVPAKVPAVTSR